MTLWVPRTLAWPLSSAFEPARPTTTPTVRTDRSVTIRPKATLPRPPARPFDHCDETRLGGLVHEYVQAA
jgi:hypothetical protein